MAIIHRLLVKEMETEANYNTLKFLSWSARWKLFSWKPSRKKHDPCKYLAVDTLSEVTRRGSYGYFLTPELTSQHWIYTTHHCPTSTEELLKIVLKTHNGKRNLLP
jgi:hypothetical protein